MGPTTNQRARALRRAANGKDAKQCHHNDAVEDHGDWFEAAVVKRCHHHHGDDPEHHVEGLLFEVGLGVLALGQE